MVSESKAEVAVNLFPFIQVFEDGTIQRLAGTAVSPPGLHPQTGVLSKDVVVIPKTGVKARIYRPQSSTTKLPLVVYLHGGAFFISSVADPNYHNSLNKMVGEANIVLVSIDYRLAPEHPLPTAYEDSWAALQWIASHVDDVDGGSEPWFNEFVDFGKVHLAGDSAGANISHHLALKMTGSELGKKLKFQGMIMIHPYFWGKEAIGKEKTDQYRKSMVDGWWDFVCPSNKGNDDPLINPFTSESPSLIGLHCCRVLVVLAENDILRDRGWLYYERLKQSEWKGKVEVVETQGVDHVFHILDSDCEKAKILFNNLSSFINQPNDFFSVVV